MTHSFPTRRSSDLIGIKLPLIGALCIRLAGHQHGRRVHLRQRLEFKRQRLCLLPGARQGEFPAFGVSMLAAPFSILCHSAGLAEQGRSEEHTSELQSLMRISYAVFCLKKKI